MVVLVVLPLLASLPALLAQDPETNRVGRLAFGLGYLPLGLALLVRLDMAPGGGPGLLLLLGLAVAQSHVGAFSLGRLFGRRRLATRLSPSKTWAGVVGNCHECSPLQRTAVSRVGNVLRSSGNGSPPQAP